MHNFFSSQSYFYHSNSRSKILRLTVRRDMFLVKTNKLIEGMPKWIIPFLNDAREDAYSKITHYMQREVGFPANFQQRSLARRLAWKFGGSVQKLSRILESRVIFMDWRTIWPCADRTVPNYFHHLDQQDFLDVAEGSQILHIFIPSAHGGACILFLLQQIPTTLRIPAWEW